MKECRAKSKYSNGDQTARENARGSKTQEGTEATKTSLKRGLRSSPPGGREKYAATSAGHDATSDSLCPRNQGATPGKPERSGGGGRRRSEHEVRKEIPQAFSDAQPGRRRSGRLIGSPRREEEEAPAIWGVEVTRGLCTSASKLNGNRRPFKKDRIRKKLQARRLQEQEHGKKRPRIGDASQSERARKRPRAGPNRPTYIPRADLLEKDHDQLVGEILMRMTPRQFETRCTYNKVHFVLSEQQRRNPFWSQPATLSLLGKGPRFIPKARLLSMKEVLGACARLNYRMVRAFERHVKREEHVRKDAIRGDSAMDS